MTAMVVQIKEKLEDNATLMAMLPGGIWNRPLKANVSTAPGHVTPMATPEAFGPLGQLRWSMTVTTEAAIPDPVVRTPLGAFEYQPVIWVYYPELDAEMDTFEQVWLQIRDSLDNQFIDGPNNTVVRLVVGSWFGPFGVEEFEDTVSMRVPIRGYGVWSA